MRKYPQAATIWVTHTIKERAGFIDGWDQRYVDRNRWRKPGVMGKGSETLRVTGQDLEQRGNRESSTFTAPIHSPRSLDVSFLHSRRTLGFSQVLFAPTVDARM